MFPKPDPGGCTGHVSCTLILFLLPTATELCPTPLGLQQIVTYYFLVNRPFSLLSVCVICILWLLYLSLASLTGHLIVFPANLSDSNKVNEILLYTFNYVLRLSHFFCSPLVTPLFCWVVLINMFRV